MNVADECFTESESSSNGRSGLLTDNEVKSNGNEISDASLFIGDLNKDVVEQDLVDSFSMYGEVVEAVIKRSRTTHIPLGYGFVTMKTPDIAQLCVQQCQNMMIKGRKIRIGKAQRNSSLVISNIDPSMTLTTLLELFGGFGEIIPEESMITPGEKLNSALIKFLHRKDAEEAKNSLNGEEVFGNCLKIEWARPFTVPTNTGEIEDRSEETPEMTSQGNSQEEFFSNYTNISPMPSFPYFPYPSPSPFQDPIISVYVKYSTTLAQRVTEEDLQRVFERFGAVTCVSIKSNMLDQVIRTHIHVEFPQEHNVQKGYAFVHYEVSPEGRMSAYQAVNALADTVIDNVRYVTEFSRNFMRLEHSLNETPARPTIYGVPYPGYGFIPTPPYPMAQPRYLYPMPFLSYQVPQMYPTAYYTMPYPPRPHLHPSTQTPSIPVPYPYATETNYPTTAADTPPSSSSNWSPVDDPMVPPENDISVPRQDPVQYSWTPPAYLPTPYSLPYPPRPMPQGIYYPPPLYSTPPPPQYFTSYPYHPPTEEN